MYTGSIYKKVNHDELCIETEDQFITLSKIHISFKSFVAILFMIAMLKISLLPYVSTVLGENPEQPHQTVPVQCLPCIETWVTKSSTSILQLLYLLLAKIETVRVIAEIKTNPKNSFFIIVCTDCTSSCAASKLVIVSDGLNVILPKSNPKH